MANLVACPVEILMQIMGGLSSSDLSNLCRTNSHLFSIAQPLAHRSIRLIWRGSHAPPIAPLLTILLRRPERAALVQNLSIDGDGVYSPRDGETRRPPSVPLAKPRSVESISISAP